MVISGQVNKVAFYCRMNHRDRDYEKYLDAVMKKLKVVYGEQEWKLKIYFEVASGADPDRKKWNLLKEELMAGRINVVVSVRASMIARDWGQFLEFMKICEDAQAEVLCLDAVENAAGIYQRIREFENAYFKGCERK